MRYLILLKTGTKTDNTCKLCSTLGIYSVYVVRASNFYAIHFEWHAMYLGWRYVLR